MNTTVLLAKEARIQDKMDFDFTDDQNSKLVGINLLVIKIIVEEMSANATLPCHFDNFT